MRPRISQQEASYILQILQENADLIKKQQERYNQVKREVDLLRLELKYSGDAYESLPQQTPTRKERGTSTT